MKLETQKLLDKASRAIRASENLLRDGDVDFAAGRAYYAMFYVAEGLLYEKELRYRKHSAVHAAFGEHFAKPGLFDAKYHRWLLAAFEKRITADYGVEESLTGDEAHSAIQQAHEFLQAVRRYVAGT